MIIKLTDNEYEILDHRLSLVQCLAEVYADTLAIEAEDAGVAFADEQYHAAYTLAENAAEKLWETLGRTRQIDADALTDVEKFALADCLDGSTFFCDMDDAVFEGELTKGKALALRRAGQSLERKLNEAGIQCQMNFD
jgi:hypothetical protein